jgi:putative YhdH/YhfP family quinone oxidoreductase
MNVGAFQAMVIDNEAGKPTASIKTLENSDLPDHDMLVEIAYSGLNYKDGLAISGRQKIARKVPLIAGIDLAGTVLDSRDPRWTAGDRVMVNGWGLSETQDGGYSRYQRLNADWLTRVPDVFSLDQAMAIGTAGYTAALCVDALESWGTIVPGSGEVLITGSAGGVGSVAIALLAARGYSVVASTGRPEAAAYLRSLGATTVIDRAEMATKAAPLQKERWSGAIDSVGSLTLVNALAQTVYGGAVAACGLAGGSDLPGTVLPHILRGVALLGIDSVMAPTVKREKAWARLARDLDVGSLRAMTRIEPMSKLPQLADAIVNGQIQGRVVIDVRA